MDCLIWIILFSSRVFEIIENICQWNCEKYYIINYRSTYGLLGNNSPPHLNDVSYSGILVIIGNMCQWDHGKYCIN